MPFSLIATRELMNEIAIRSLLHSYARVRKVCVNASIVLVSRASEKHGIRVKVSVIGQLERTL